ncbi:unnamed protein product [Rhizopus stolonifer]
MDNTIAKFIGKSPSHKLDSLKNDLVTRKAVVQEVISNSVKIADCTSNVMNNYLGKELGNETKLQAWQKYMAENFNRILAGISSASRLTPSISSSTIQDMSSEKIGGKDCRVYTISVKKILREDLTQGLQRLQLNRPVKMQHSLVKMESER